MALTFDAVGPSSAGAGSASSPLTFSATVSASANLLVVFGACGASTDTSMVLTATAGGTTMSAGTAVHTDNATAGFLRPFWLVAPPTGTVSIVLTKTGGTGTISLCAFSASLIGASSSAPTFTSAVGESTTAALTTTSATGHIVLSAAAGGSSFSARTQTLMATKNESSSNGAGNIDGSRAAGASSVAFSHTLGSDIWAVINADIAPAVSVVAAPQAALIGI